MLNELYICQLTYRSQINTFFAGADREDVARGRIEAPDAEAP